MGSFQTFLAFLMALFLAEQATAVVSTILSNKTSTTPRLAATDAKQVPDITQYGYSMVESDPLSGSIPLVGPYIKWDIHNSGNYKTKVLNTFGYIAGLRTVAIYEAWNGDDDTPNRLKLRDLMLGWWNAQSGMTIDKIQQIYWVQSEPGTDVSEVISLAYERMGVAEDQELTVNADSDSNPEIHAFELISGTRIANGVNSMLGEYAEFDGQRIESFTMMEHEGGPAFDLWINLGEDDSTPGPPGK